MSTERYTVVPSDGWVKFAEDSEAFICEISHLGYGEVTMQDSSPLTSAPFHGLRAGTLFVRPGSGNAYVRVSPDFPTSSIELIVSKGS